jgi:hypothetical protein
MVHTIRSRIWERKHSKGIESERGRLEGEEAQ